MSATMAESDAQKKYWRLSKQKLIKLCERNNISCSTKADKEEMIQRLIHSQSSTPQRNEQLEYKIKPQHKPHRILRDIFKCRQAVDYCCMKQFELDGWTPNISALILTYCRSTIDEFLNDEKEIRYWKERFVGYGQSNIRKKETVIRYTLSSNGLIKYERKGGQELKGEWSISNDLSRIVIKGLDGVYDDYNAKIICISTLENRKKWKRSLLR